MEDRNDIEKLFSGAFENFEATVPASAWENIEAQLQKKKKKGLLLWWKWGAAASFVLGTGIGLYYLQNNAGSSVQYAARKIAPVMQEVDSMVAPANVKIVDKGQEVDANPTKKIKTSSDATIAKGNAGKSTQANAIARTEAVVKDSEEIPAQKTIESHNKTEGEKVADPPAAKQDETVKPQKLLLADINKPLLPVALPDKRRVQEDSDWLLAANVQSGTVSNSNGAQPEALATNNDNRSPTSGSGFTENFDATGTVAEQAEQNNTRYAPPIVFGLQLGKRLNNYWNIDGGLSYTILNSTSDPTAAAPTSNQVSYLGFPIGVRRNFGDRRAVSLYMSTGYVPEKSLGVTVRYPNSTLAASKLADYGWQHSVFLGGGVNVQMNKVFVLYLQPSYSFYLKQHSNPYNFRISSRWWPSVQIGLRFQLPKV